MNIDEANTEPFYRFHRFHEELSLNMRILVAGLAELKKVSAQNKAAGRRTHLSTDSEPWSPNVWEDLGRPIADATRFVAQMGVVRVIAALEDFCVGAKAEYDRWAEHQGIRQNAGSDDAEGISPKTLYNATGWDKGVLGTIDPFYEYFSKVRNCIVHRAGRGSRDLKQFAASAALSKCAAGWHPEKTQKKVPALPTITVGDELPLLPRHAILANEVCRRIAADANLKLLAALGIDGVVNMAAHHSLLSDRPIKTNARKSPEAILNTILAVRYRVKLDKREESIVAMVRLQKWTAYRRKFDRLQTPK